MSLQRYRSKRDFHRTPEPAGGEAASPQPELPLFVVHKHAARRLHYDLRLEHEGVLESWAVPKEPALEPGEKRLAVRVEDHPLEYGDFEGVIPEGEYGAGTVMLWDRGTCQVQHRSEERLDFVLLGKKLHGSWTLVRMNGHAGKDGRNWLLIKRHDKADWRGPEVPRDTSIASGRSMEQIAADRDRTWRGAAEAGKEPTRSSGESAAGKGSGPSAREKLRLNGEELRVLETAPAAPLPRNPRPQLATLTDRTPQGRGWLHEIKFDGYRILARIDKGEVTLLSRNGQNWTARFPEIAAALQQMPAADVLLDGEVVALDTAGVSSFRLLQEALSVRRTASLVYQVFDLLYLNGHDLTETALIQRKPLLARLLEAREKDGPVRYTDHIEDQGAEFFASACRLGLEGVVSKRADSIYRETRTKSWLKVKCIAHEELLVGGYTDPGGARQGFGALLLGGYRGGRLVYAGKVGTGFSVQQLQSLHELLQGLEVKVSPFDTPPPERGVHWVKPELVVEVEYSEWTRDGFLRHPSFRGLREDRNPREIRLPDEGRQASQAHPRPAGGDGATVAGVHLSNPERILYPRQGITKIALAHFYQEIGDWILPGLAGRPLSLVRCPQGRGKKCFFQKHPGEMFPDSLPRIEITEKEGSAQYLYVRTLPDLVSLIQAGTLELHAWGCHVEDVEHPDLLVFDLDPGEGVPWPEVLRTAAGLRDRLGSFGLESFVRTTGGKGLHLVVPLLPKLGWEDAKSFARAIAQAQSGDDPGRLTTNLSKAKRRGRIFVDYLRNGRGATAIVSYSTRAREGAPVAVPLRWDELNAATRSDRYDVGNLKGRLKALRTDPWDGFEEARRPLTGAMLSAVKPKGRSKR